MTYIFVQGVAKAVKINGSKTALLSIDFHFQEEQVYSKRFQQLTH